MCGRFVPRAGTAVFALFVASCISSEPTYDGPWIHRSFFEGPPRAFPHRIVLLPARVEQFWFPEKPIEPPDKGVWVFQPDKSRADTETVERVLESSMKEHAPFEILDLPELGAEERSAIEQHLALFSVVADAASDAGNEWGTPSFKLREFDYTIGPGLRGLKERTGAEGGLLVCGYFAQLFVGIVDLESGDVLWLGRAVSERRSGGFTEEGVRQALALPWSQFPGFVRYERLRRKA